MDEKLNQTVESPSTVADTVDTSAEQARLEANEAGTSATTVSPEPSTASTTNPEIPTPESNDSPAESVTEVISSETTAANESSDTPATASEGSETTAVSEITEPTAEAASSEATASEATEAETTESEATASETTESAESSLENAFASALNESETTAAVSEASAPVTEEISDEVANQMTMEDVMAASDERLANPPVHRGMMVTGTIIMVSQEGLVVDIGQKIEGVIPFSQISEQEISYDDVMQIDALQAGREIQAYVIRADIPNSSIILSKKRADQERAWNLLQDIYDKKLPVEVEIIERVKGGLVAMLGVRAFLPASQVDIRRVTDLTPYVGQRLKVRIIELNRKRNRVIISRREILEEEVSELKAETLKKLEPGAEIEGEVVEITDFGAFVNLGGVDGLVHRSEITHGRFNHPREVLKVGQKVQVQVLDMDLEKERINLSRKNLLKDPWQAVLDNYSIGQRISGKVTNLTQFGAFVEIEAGLEGLVHVSEMSWTKRVRHPKEVVSEGDDVEAMILKIDVEQQRVSLGMRQTQPDPWSSLPDNYPPGTEVSGPITGITDFGVFIEIEEGIEGLIHISELDNKRIEDINEHFKKGDVLEAIILNIDPVEQRASLSRKKTLPYEPESFDDGAQQQQGGGGRGRGKGGRRGRRGGQSIDYDYSYVSSEGGGSSRSTTKLGDVYADLFAQFGLADSAASSDTPAPAEENKEVESPATTNDVAPQARAEEASAEVATPEASDATSSEAIAEPTPAEAPVAKQVSSDEAETTEATEATEATEEAVAPEDAIDAAEAAALLTAAFREGRRPDAADAEETDSNA